MATLMLNAPQILKLESGVNVILLAVDLQNIVIYNEYGEIIGWINEWAEVAYIKLDSILRSIEIETEFLKRYPNNLTSIQWNYVKELPVIRLSMKLFYPSFSC